MTSLRPPYFRLLPFALFKPAERHCQLAPCLFVADTISKDYNPQISKLEYTVPCEIQH